MANQYFTRRGEKHELKNASPKQIDDIIIAKGDVTFNQIRFQFPRFLRNRFTPASVPTKGARRMHVFSSVILPIKKSMLVEKNLPV